MDLSLDLNPTSPTYRDLLVVNGGLVATSDANSAGTPYVAQNIQQRLQMFLGEWFLDKTLGLPYFQQIFIKNPNRAAVDANILAVIVGTPGVLRVTQYKSTFTSVNRLIRISFLAITASGVVSYDGPLNTASSMVTQ